jgi:TonB family protein
MSDLFEGAIKISAILLVALFAGVVLKKQSAALRHWVLAIAVACALATPLLSRIVPDWLGAPLWNRGVALDAGQATHAGQRPSREAAGAQSVAVQTEFSVALKSQAAFESLNTGRVVQGVWLFGSVVSAFLLLLGATRLWWLASRARDIDTGPWRELAEQVRRSYGLATPIRLLLSDHPSLLVTWGWRRPTILLPPGAQEWSEDRIRVVLAHELAHVARRDWTVQLAAEVLRAVYWFNPLLWIACRRLRIESECACDDAVLARGIDGPEYATHLLALARSLHSGRQPWLPAPAMARSSSLEGRVRAMLNITHNRRPVSWAARVTTVGALLALTVPVAGLRAQFQFYSLTGAALDPTNRVLPDTRLVLTNATSHAKYEVRTDTAGRFEFVGLPPAEYTLEAILPGFASLKEDLRIGGPTERDVRLRVGSLQETITVTDRSIPVVPPDAATTQKREEARRRSAEFEQREKTRCAEGGAATLVGGRILPPAKLLNVRPVYPDHLRAAKVRGTVTMDAVIGADGIVREVKNLRGPHPDLEAAAAEAVRRWQFSTTLLNCEPIEVDMKVTTNFAVQP